MISDRVLQKRVTLKTTPAKVAPLQNMQLVQQAYTKCAGTLHPKKLTNEEAQPPAIALQLFFAVQEGAGPRVATMSRVLRGI